MLNYQRVLSLRWRLLKIEFLGFPLQIIRADIGGKIGAHLEKLQTAKADGCTPSAGAHGTAFQDFFRIFRGVWSSQIGVSLQMGDGPNILNGQRHPVFRQAPFFEYH